MTKGVNVVVTPWRDHKELLKIRDQLYARKDYLEVTSLREGQRELNRTDLKTSCRREACDQISAWSLRGPLPHAIESTWLLTLATLADIPKPNTSTNHLTTSVFAIKAGYMTALTRFVTALLDSAQTSKFKISMYTKAAELGLPAIFVDLRHEATHGDMPSLTVLREMCERALDWLWGDYWTSIVDGEESMSSRGRKESEVGIEGMEADGEGGKVEPWRVWEGLWRAKAIGTVYTS